MAALAALALLAAPASADGGIDAGTNAFRASNGLSTLGTSSVLTAYAVQRSYEIVGDFSHHLDALYQFGVSHGCAAWGENIAWISNTSGADWAVNAWINSPAHRANMLGAYTAQGSALLHLNGHSYAVQIFGKNCGGKAVTTATAPRPAPIPKAIAQPIPAPVVALPDTAMSQP